MAPFPLIKLGALLLKQISKPIADFAKQRAKSSPFFRTYVCMPPAQLYNWWEIKLKMWILNLGKPVNIPVLSEQMAIELGANLLGESIVFCIAAAALLAEYNRSSSKEAGKERARKEEVNNLKFELQELHLRIEQQDTQLREIHRYVSELLNSKKSLLGGILNKGPKTDSDDTKKPPSGLSGPRISSIANDLQPNESFSVVNYALYFVQNDLLNNKLDEGIYTDSLHCIEKEVYSRTLII